MKAKLELSKQYYLEDGKKVFTGEFTIDWICPKCNKLMHIFRLMKTLNNRVSIEIECNCGYQEEVNLIELSKKWRSI